jgi:hypothetical protein
MTAKDRIGKAAETAWTAQRNQLVQRLLHDDDLRNSLTSAYGAARSAYGRMSNGKPTTRTLMEDKKLQRELKQAIDALKDASGSLRPTPPPKRRGRGKFGLLLVLVCGGVLALAVSESLRSKVLDVLFGAEEEFEYNNTADTSDTPAQETEPTVSPQPS